MTLKIGDVVQLKSGSPRMTVTKLGLVGGSEAIICSWFDGMQQHHGSFPPDALELSPQPASARIVR